MLHLVTYRQFSELVSGSFAEHLTSQDTQSNKWVVPDPYTADALRAALTDIDMKNETITWSYFLKSLNQEVLKIPEGKVLGKAGLLICLSRIWKQVVKEQTSSEFFKIYKLFTDLRSFSLDIGVLDTVLEEYSEEQANLLRSFYEFMNQEQFEDEHSLAYKVSEKLRDLDEDVHQKTNYFIYGFSFLSGIQVDLIRNLSQGSNVYIILPVEVYKNLQPVDWPSWLLDDQTKYYESPKIEFEENKAQVFTYTKGYLSTVLEKVLIENQINDVFLLGQDTQMSRLQQIISHEIKLKESYSLFEQDHEKLMGELKERVLQSKSFTANDLQSLLEESLKDALKQKKYLKTKLFIEVLKILKLLAESEEAFMENELEDLDLSIIRQVTDLNLPRNFALTSTMEEQHYLKKNFELDFLDDTKGSSLIIGDDSFGIIQGDFKFFSDSVENFLASIGPVRRREFELSFTLSRVKEALKHKTFILLQEGLIEENLDYSLLFEGTDKRSKIAIDHKKNMEKIKSYKLDSALEEISATKLQTFFDCSMKYFYRYEKQFRKDLHFQQKLSFLDLGRLEHLILERYFKNFNEFSLVQFQKLLFVVFEEYMQSKAISLSEIKKQYYLLELETYCAPFLEELYILKNKTKAEIEFEKRFSVDKDGIKHYGSIDLFIKYQNMVLALDFKRSGASIPSQKDLQAFKKVQLWFYLDKIHQGHEYLGVGYICLSELDQSFILMDDSSEMNEFKSLDLNILKRIKKQKEMKESLTSYQEFQNRLLLQMKSGQAVKADPIDPKICSFCEFQNICDKGINL